MNTRLHTAIVLAALGVSAAALSTKAEACNISGYGMPSSLQWSLPHTLPNSAAASIVEASAAAQASAASNGAAASATNPLQLLEPITGLWHFTFTSKNNPGIPDGAQLDTGFATWHADGTEIMNSGKPPPSSSFCMGVFRHTSVYGYKLNHYALGWNNSGTVFLGPANIREQIQLDRGGNTYSGTFMVTQFAPDGTTAMGHVTGTVSAQRLTPDTN